MTTPLVIGFDVEPDGQDIPRRERRRWRGFERTLELTGTLRDRLDTALGSPVRFSWYLRMDPQITDVYGSPAWVVDTYGTELGALRRAGDELGLHPHALRWDERAGGWLTDTASAPWVEECVRTSFDTFAAAFGERCRSHRFGDRYMSNRIVALLRELQVDVDLTLEPGRAAAMTPVLSAPIPGQMMVPRTPYQPDPADFARPASERQPGGLWILPVAAADPDQALPIWRRIGRRLRHHGQPMHRPVLIWAPWPSTVLWDIVARDVEAGDLTVLPFMVRADTLLDPGSAERFVSHLLALAGHRLGRSVAITTPGEAVRAIAAMPQSAG